MYAQELLSQTASESKLQANSSVQPSGLNVTVISSVSKHETTSHDCSGVSSSYVVPLIVPLFPFGDKSRTCASSGPSSKFQHPTKPFSFPVGGQPIYC